MAQERVASIAVFLYIVYGTLGIIEFGGGLRLC